jgi:hypothetical protein
MAMLVLDPELRISAVEALSHPYFDDLRGELDVKIMKYNRLAPDPWKEDSATAAVIDEYVQDDSNNTDLSHVNLGDMDEDEGGRNQAGQNDSPVPRALKIRAGSTSHRFNFLHLLLDREAEISRTSTSSFLGNGPNIEIEGQDLRSAVVHGGLYSHHRAMLADWLIEVVDVFDMAPRTAFLAIALSDHYLMAPDCPRVIPRTEYQLLGATCLHLASKVEDVSYIGVEDLGLFSTFPRFNLKLFEQLCVLIMFMSQGMC